ncbi:MAG: transcriptional regulator [Actinobacteria bacterium]|nr:transcriptional regulator [Actinomycetota bacterium]
MSRKSIDPIFNRIEAVRTSRGLTRDDLARLTGVHYQTIGYLERGEFSPSLVLALRIAEELDVAVEDVFSLTSF